MPPMPVPSAIPSTIPSATTSATTRAIPPPLAPPATQAATLQLRLLTLAAISAIFAVAYGLANHWTAQRSDIGRGVFEFERAIPFVPWSIVPYLSLVGFYAASFFVGDRAALRVHALRLLLNLVLALACYALMPLRFQFERPATAGLCGLLFDLLGAFDLPYNRAPSLHISVMLIVWVRLRPFASPRWRAVLHLWFALIGMSVLTTYQHHLIDIPAGLAIGALCVWLLPSTKRRAVVGAKTGASTFRSASRDAHSPPKPSLRSEASMPKPQAH